MDIRKEPKKRPTDNAIWILAISHKNGTYVNAFARLQRAIDDLYGYCFMMWDDALTEQRGAIRNLSQEEVIDAYFDYPETAIDVDRYRLEERIILP